MESHKSICEGRALRIVVGLTALVILMAVALSGADVSDNVTNNYPDIASSNGNFPDHPPVRPLHALYPQHAEQFSNNTGAQKLPVLTAATGDVNITKIGHLGGSTYAV